MILLGLISLLAFSLAQATDATHDPATLLQRLDALITQDTADDSLDDLTNLRNAALDAGPSALPLLRPLLPTASQSVRYRVAYALAFTGQTEIVDPLVAEFKRTKDLSIKAMACFASARRGTDADVRFLIKALKGEQFGDEWPPIEVAALSLGVLRDRSAIAPLQVAAKKTPGSISGGAAAEALSWIRKGTFNVPATSVGDDLLPVLAVMRHGVPRILESPAYFESDAHRVWRRTGRKWSLQPSQNNIEGSPTISFTTVVSADRKRAVVSVGLLFGPLNGVGFDYLLSDRGGSWSVIGILPTWIS